MPITTSRTFGAAPCGQYYRATARSYRPNLGADLPLPDFYFQKIAFIRDQMARPSCVAQSIHSYLDVALKDIDPAATYGSAVGTWRDAKRRQGSTHRVVGTQPQYAFESLSRRGIDPMRPNEDMDEELEPNDEESHLGDEFAADGHRLPATFGTELIPASSETEGLVINALMSGFGIAKSAGVSQAYGSHYAATDSEAVVWGPENVGTYGAGHMERLFGFQKLGDSYIYAIQGSWGLGAGGIRTADEQWRQGCYWIDAKSLAKSWDICILKL